MQATRRLLAALLVGAAASACAKASGTGSVEGPSWPTGSDQLVLRVDTCCGFIAPDYTLTQIPSFSLVGDGRFMVPGPQIEIYPGPALPNVQESSITDEGIRRILDAAREAGVYEGHEYLGTGAVADAATTIFTVVDADGTRHVTKAYALSEARSDPNMSGDERRARERLFHFQEQLGRLREWLPEGSVGDEHEYRFDELRVYSRPYAPTDESTDLKEPEKRWPLDTPLATFGSQVENLEGYRCGVVTGGDLEKLLPDVKDSNQLTPWTSDSERYRLYFRPLLPDESGC